MSMGVGASNKQIEERLRRKMRRCATCKYCKPRKVKPGDMAMNDCEKQPLLVFFTNVDKICRYHSDIEWLISKGFNWNH